MPRKSWAISEPDWIPLRKAAFAFGLDTDGHCIIANDASSSSLLESHKESTGAHQIEFDLVSLKLSFWWFASASERWDRGKSGTPWEFLKEPKQNPAPVDYRAEAEVAFAFGFANDEETKAYLDSLPKLGLPIVLTSGERGPARPYSKVYAQRRVREARRAAKLGDHVTLDACRHGGMTELGDADLTEQGVMTLSGHKTPTAARLYIKRTEKQRVSAARKRLEWINANEPSTNVGTERQPKSRNGTGEGP